MVGIVTSVEGPHILLPFQLRTTDGDLFTGEGGAAETDRESAEAVVLSAV